MLCLWLDDRMYSKCKLTVFETTSYGSGRKPTHSLSKKVTIKTDKIDQAHTTPMFQCSKNQPNASSNLEVIPGGYVPMFKRFTSFEVERNDYIQ